MLTTIDNPYNPTQDYVKWMQWDQQHGYYTAEYVATMANVSADMDDDQADALIELAINGILENDTLNRYKLVE